MSGGSLNTAQALLKAENYEGARRIVCKALDENPDNLGAWQLRVKIEMDSGKHNDALVFVRQILAKHPDNAALRGMEFDTLVRSRQKKEAATARDRFRADFPFHTARVEQMDLQLDASAGRTKKVSAKLREYADHVYGLDGQKDLAIAHHRIDDIFRARRLMDEVHPEFPNDVELNAAMASNYLQLARPATARKHARLALAANPADRRMSLLIKTSWLMYFPPFYMMTVILMIFYGFDTLVGRIASYVLIFSAVYMITDYSNIFYSVLIVVTGLNLNWISTLLLIGFLILYACSMNAGVYDKIFKRKKSVSLKKY